MYALLPIPSSSHNVKLPIPLLRETTCNKDHMYLNATNEDDLK